MWTGSQNSDLSTWFSFGRVSEDHAAVTKELLNVQHSFTNNQPTATKYNNVTAKCAFTVSPYGDNQVNVDKNNDLLHVYSPDLT